MNSKLLDRIESLFASHKALILIIIGLFLIRIPSILEPLWYGDEAIYVAIGQEINRGGLLYVDIFDFTAFFIFVFLSFDQKRYTETIKNLIQLTIGMAIPFGVTFIYFSVNG